MDTVKAALPKAGCFQLSGYKKIICVAMMISALALFVFSVAGTQYLNRASPPDTIADTCLEVIVSFLVVEF